MTVKMTMHDKILSYMNKYGSIDPEQAWEELHTQKLATRISELIDRGYPIEKSWVYRATPGGGKKKVFKVYTLRREG